MNKEILALAVLKRFEIPRHDPTGGHYGQKVSSYYLSEANSILSTSNLPYPAGYLSASSAQQTPPANSPGKLTLQFPAIPATQSPKQEASTSCPLSPPFRKSPISPSHTGPPPFFLFIPLPHENFHLPPISLLRTSRCFSSAFARRSCSQGCSTRRSLWPYTIVWSGRMS